MPSSRTRKSRSAHARIQGRNNIDARMALFMHRMPKSLRNRHKGSTVYGVNRRGGGTRKRWKNWTRARPEPIATWRWNIRRMPPASLFAQSARWPRKTRIPCIIIWRSTKAIFLLSARPVKKSFFTLRRWLFILPPDTQKRMRQIFSVPVALIRLLQGQIGLFISCGSIVIRMLPHSLLKGWNVPHVRRSAIVIRHFSIILPPAVFSFL